MEGDKLNLVAITGGKFHTASLTFHFQIDNHNFEYVQTEFRKPKSFLGRSFFGLMVRMGVFDYCEFNGGKILNQFRGSFQIIPWANFNISHHFAWVEPINVGEMF